MPCAKSREAGILCKIGDDVELQEATVCSLTATEKRQSMPLFDLLKALYRVLP